MQRIGANDFSGISFVGIAPSLIMAWGVITDTSTGVNAIKHSVAHL